MKKDKAIMAAVMLLGAMTGKIIPVMAIYLIAALFTGIKMLLT